MVNTRHYHGGGDSTYAFNLASLLREKGHHVSFFAMQDERNLPDPNSDLFVSPINFRDLNQKKNLKTGWQVLTRSIYSNEARKKFALLLEREKPDIIHVHNLHAHITPSILFEARKQGIPVVWTLHDYKLVCPNSHLLIDTTGNICEACKGGRFYQAVWKKCKKGSFLASFMACLEAYVHQILGIRDLVDVFLTPSEFLRNVFLENGFPSEKIVHIPYQIAIPHRTRSRVLSDYFLFLGKLDRIKGIYVLAEAAKNLPEIEFRLAGKADDKEAQDFLSTLPPNMHYLGMKTGVELATLLGDSRALILPSIWYENQPLVILEAFAAGKPVIVSNLGGMKELAKPEERGLLFEAGNARQLAASIKFLYENPDKCEEYGKNSLEYVKQYHSSDEHYRQIMNIYTRLAQTAHQVSQ